jgi:hypothetical protein
MSNKHGGARKGAGRKSSPAKYRGRYLKLPPDVENWLKEHRKKTGKPINQFIIEAIQEKIERTE